MEIPKSRYEDTEFGEGSFDLNDARYSSRPGVS